MITASAAVMPGKSPAQRTGRMLARYVLPPLVLACVLLGAQVPWPGALALGLAAALAAYLISLRVKAAPAAVRTREWDDQMIQSQKLAALGQLATGIAHEINTPLAIIGQEAELLDLEIRDLEATAPENARRLRDAAGRITSQVERCGEITHGMLDLARKNDPVPQTTDVAALVEDMVALVERGAMKDGVRFLRDYEPGLHTVRTSSPMLRQVMLNLLVNATQAMEGGGTVMILVTNDDQGVAIEVRDNGPGIAPENMDQIFNPFFTTKPPGKGTGLGLSVCLGIMDRLGGAISARNNSDGGASFTLRLPRNTPGPGTEVKP